MPGEIWRGICGPGARFPVWGMVQGIGIGWHFHAYLNGDEYGAC